MDELPTPSGGRSPLAVADRPARSPRTSPPPAAPRRGARLPGRRQARRIVAAVLVGAGVMLGVATLDTVAGATVPVLGSLAALPSPNGTSADVEDIPPPPTTPGTCLNWARADAADTAVVDCAQPHLFEQSGTVQLTDQQTLPDDATMRQLVNERCTPVVLQYLGGRFDPNGKFRVGALKPSQKKWDEGDRELRCGVQSASRSGALYPLSGKAADQDQSGVYEPGTCLAIDGPRVGDPTDCAGPHAVETVGVVDLSQKFPGGFPAVGDQDGFLQPECSRIAGDYAGGPQVITDKKLTVYWDNITEESWNAGTRKVNCNLAALLPDRSGFAPVTGPVKGAVSVGDQPAPPATTTPKPGVPAPPTQSGAPTTDPSVPPSSSEPAPPSAEAPPSASESAGPPAAPLPEVPVPAP
ncbi:septum formation family protein [Pseudonocardia kujensis]|uniref:septum formation family protein n=1 Tax=Pseudonocardia kujensis TaxID=1128675 RepID=UPI001E42C07A|nr:septum formation family protein [Pseudonocardia kujensis]MCE0761800.1 septum formation family protein [Pseudonocardia kujensis]